MTEEEQIAEDEDARLDVKFERITINKLKDVYCNGFVDGQSKAALKNQTIIRSVRAEAFSAGYDAGFDAGYPKGVRMSDIAAEDLQKILAGISTKDIVNELADRINDGEKLPTFKRKFNTSVTKDGIEHMPLESGYK